MAARIGRYENPYLTVGWQREPPAGTVCETFQLVTQDRALSDGWLYRKGGEDTVVCVMHPRANFSHHYVVPALVEAGFAVFCQNSRWVGNDMTLVHEPLLLDVAAGVGAMRARFDRVVLLGNSGGGSLYTFYLSQALAPEGKRLSDTPAGDPFDLNRFELAPADQMVYLAAHPGEGFFLQTAIDPSVVDEADPVSCDPELDMFEPENGFAEPPNPSHYAPEFVQRYRAAQLARIDRLDVLARHRIARRNEARRLAAGGSGLAERRGAIATEYLVIYRTEADLRCTDLALDPSSRDYGSLFTRRPDLSNYGAMGFARVLTPEAWLSTWSGRASRAEIPDTGAGMTLPALVLGYTGDNGIFPSDTDRIVDALASSDLERAWCDGDHYGLPAERGRELALQRVIDWLRRKA